MYACPNITLHVKEKKRTLYIERYQKLLNLSHIEVEFINNAQLQYFCRNMNNINVCLFEDIQLCTSDKSANNIRFNSKYVLSLFIPI